MNLGMENDIRICAKCGGAYHLACGLCDYSKGCIKHCTCTSQGDVKRRMAEMASFKSSK